MEHNARKVGMGDTGETDLTGRGRPQGGGNVLQGGGSSNNTVCIGDVGIFGSNVEEGRRDTYMVPQTYHGEASAAVRRQEVGDIWGGSSVGSSGNTFTDDLYRDMTGNCIPVGGVATTIRCLCKGEGGGYRTQEGGVLAPRGDRETTLGHLGRNIAGG